MNDNNSAHRAPAILNVGNARTGEVPSGEGIFNTNTSLIVERGDCIDVYDCFHVDMSEETTNRGFIVCNVARAIRVEIPDVDDIIEFLGLATSYEEFDMTYLPDTIKNIDLSTVEAVNRADYWVINKHFTNTDEGMGKFVTLIFKFLM